MKFPEFDLECWKAEFVSEEALTSGWIDLTETGIEPIQLREVFYDKLLDFRLDYSRIYGPNRLRELISELYDKVEPERVLVTTGTSEGNLLGTNMVIRSGDSLVVQVPAFMQLPGIVEGLGTRITWFWLREEEKFQINMDRLNEIVTNNTKAIVLCYPNNPTGQILSTQEVKGICEIAKDRGAWIIVDEVYRGLEFEGPFSPSFAEYYDKAIVTSSFSKVWGAAALRIGWMIAPREVVDAATKLKHYTTLSTSSLNEQLAIRILEKDRRDQFIKRGRGLAREYFQIFDNWMDSHKEDFGWIKPKFGVITFLKNKLKISSDDFVKAVYNNRAIIAPGRLFGFNDYLRVSYCQPPDRLREALRRVDKTIEETK